MKSLTYRISSNSFFRNSKHSFFDIFSSMTILKGGPELKLVYFNQLFDNCIVWLQHRSLP